MLSFVLIVASSCMVSMDSYNMSAFYYKKAQKNNGLAALENSNDALEDTRIILNPTVILSQAAPRSCMKGSRKIEAKKQQQTCDEQSYSPASIAQYPKNDSEK